jgi:GxxExxY protein
MNPQISQIDTDGKDKPTHAIIGATMEVHRQPSPGFLETVYQEALALEFEARSLVFERERELCRFSTRDSSFHALSGRILCAMKTLSSN